MIKLRKVTEKEIATALLFIEQAKAHLKEQGIDQWQDGYPNLDSVKADVDSDRGYFITADGVPAGYLCLDFEGEPVYSQLDGSWKCTEGYAALHRLAVGDDYRSKGVGKKAFAACEALCREKGIFSIRVDTKDANPKMRHVVTSNGYEYRGDVWYDSCGTRMAFEKVF